MTNPTEAKVRAVLNAMRVRYAEAGYDYNVSAIDAGLSALDALPQEPAAVVPLGTWQPEAPPAGAVGTATTPAASPAARKCRRCGGLGSWTDHMDSGAEFKRTCHDCYGTGTTPRRTEP